MFMFLLATSSHPTPPTKNIETTNLLPPPLRPYYGIIAIPGKKKSLNKALIQICLRW